MWYRGRFALTADGRIMKWGMKTRPTTNKTKKTAVKVEYFVGKTYLCTQKLMYHA